MIWLCVFVRIVANPFSNVFQKLLTRRAANPLFIICATHALLSLAVAPIVLFFLPPLSAEFWWNIAICTLLNVAGNALLVQAVKLSDLSVLGPINAYKAIVSLLPGMILLHEIPGAAGLSGMLLILAGTYFLVEQDADQPGRNVLVRLLQDRGVRYRFAALILSASEAIFLKRALLASSALTTFALWSLLGFGASLAAVAVAFRTERIRQELRVMQASKLTYLSLFATTGLMQFCTIVALGQFQVGYALALFQTSSLVSVALGHQFFHERHFAKRLTGSLVMAAGAALIIVASVQQPEAQAARICDPVSLSSSGPIRRIPMSAQVAAYAPLAVGVGRPCPAPMRGYPSNGPDAATR